MYADDTHVTLTSNNVDDLITNAHRELRNGMDESKQAKCQP